MGTNIDNKGEDKIYMKKIFVASPNLNGNEKKYVEDCLNTTLISSGGGQYIEKFENEFAEFCGAQYAASCCNGTVALHLALLALGIKVGDEVIMPVITYIATANAVKYVGATPVFVDIDEDTWNIDVSKIEEKITKNTRAIIVVHLYGNPAQMDEIMKIAQKHNLYVIEDAAEAHGATYKGKKVGSIGDIGTFSFFGNKVITTGEGGMIVTKDEKLDQYIRLLKGQGVDPQKRYWHLEIGYNYRMTNIAAAIGLGQLENINDHINKRIQIREMYYNILRKYSDYIKFQRITDQSTSINWMTSIIFLPKVGESRDNICKKLEGYGIETRPVFYPINTMPPYKQDGNYPVAEYISSSGINLPTHDLLSEQDIEYICNHLVQAMGITE